MKKVIFLFVPLMLFILFIIASCEPSEKSKQLSPRVNHVMLYVTDLDLSIEFYTKAFDLQVTNRLDQLIVVQADGSEVGRPIEIAFLKFPGQDFVYEMAEQPADTTHQLTNNLFQHVGIDVIDIDAAFKRAIEAGAEELLAVRTVKAKGIEAKQAFLKGPDGERIELMQIISGMF